MIDVSGMDDPAVERLAARWLIARVLDVRRSQAAAARCLGIDATTLSKIRAGQRTPNPRQLLRMLASITDELDSAEPALKDAAPTDDTLTRDERAVLDLIEEFGGPVRASHILLRSLRTELSGRGSSAVSPPNVGMPPPDVISRAAIGDAPRPGPRPRAVPRPDEPEDPKRRAE